jgi:CheY-like chemotaxis protein
MTAAGPTVLYVDDDESDRFFMQLAFSDARLSSALQIVEDGQAAIQYLSGEGSFADRTAYPFPSLILLDIKLPGLSGFEVLNWIRSQPGCAGLPVVLFSSSNLPADRLRANQLGAQDYIEKPGSGLLYRRILERLCAKWLKIPFSSPFLSAPGHSADPPPPKIKDT